MMLIFLTLMTHVCSFHVCTLKSLRVYSEENCNHAEAISRDRI